MSTVRTFERFGRAFAVKVTQWLNSRDGVAAIEFAFVVPVLLVLYFLTLEAGQAIETRKKVSRIASMMGDLVTQEQEITSDQMFAIAKIGGALLKPYTRSYPSMEIEGIKFDDHVPPRAKRVWRREYKYDDHGNFKETKVIVGANEYTNDVPEPLKTKDAFLVRSYVNLKYEPVIIWDKSGGKPKSRWVYSPFQPGMNMSDVYFFGARRSNELDCTDCNTPPPH